jgi:peptidoglycan/LPS O-acetylase OafA/YrhL
MTRDTSFLNFFRGLAALWVVLAHCGIWGSGGVPDVLEPKKAVDLFMVISGFLMVYTVDRASDREQPFAWSTWRKFYIRRFFRIAPAYYAALATVFVLQGALAQGAGNLMALHPERWGSATAGYPDFSLKAMFLHLTFLFGLLPSYASVSGLPAWSLSVEMQFYALFPLVYMAARRWSLARVCVCLAALSLLFSRQYFHAVDAGRVSRFAEPSLLEFHFAKFATGMLIYEAGRLRRPFLLLLAGLVLLVTVRVYGTSAILLVLIVASLAAFWYVGVPAWAGRSFHSGVVTFLSDSSYSVYLLHNMVINLVGWPVLAWALEAGAPLKVAETALTVSVVLTAYPLAYVIFLTVERAGISWGKQIAHSRAPVAAPMT